MQRNGRVCFLVVSIGVMLFLIGTTPITTPVVDSYGVFQSPRETVVGPDLDFQSVVAYSPHDPIYIVGDSEFADMALAEGWPGDGTEGNPFMIKGLKIESTITDQNCIFIQDTNVYFAIEDCYLTGASGMDVYGEVCGIHLINVRNGHIANNILVDNSVGIGLGIIDLDLSELGSSQNSIVNNNITLCSFGVALFSSSDNLIKGNWLFQSEIFLWKSSDNTLESNIASPSVIGLHGSPRNIVDANDLGEGHIYVTYILDRFTSEVIGSHDTTITNNIVSMIYILESNDTLVDANTVSHPTGSDGIIVSDCARITINNNDIFDISERGLFVLNSQDTLVTNNKIFACRRSGVEVHSSERTTIHNNGLMNNGDWGIALLTNVDTEVYDNALLYNAENAIVDVGEVGIPIAGNFWSDYTGVDADDDGFGDTPYVGYGFEDPIPLVRLSGYHLAISIDGDSDFADQALEEGWSGDGTYQYPYIIENYCITGGTDGSCISMKNLATSEFVIRNCFLVAGDSGVYLEEVESGLYVEDCTLIQNGYGIFAQNTFTESYTNIVESHFYYNDYAIHQTMRGAAIQMNDFVGNGVGVYIEMSMMGVDIDHNIFSENLGTAIHLYQTSVTQIIENHISSLQGYGILLEECMEGRMKPIHSNFVQNSQYGICLTQGSGDMQTSDFMVFGNMFRGDIADAIDDGENNLFEYNVYWSYSGSDDNQDNIGDTPHSIEGTVGNQDSTPFMGLWWESLPTDQMLDVSQPFEYDLDFEVHTLSFEPDFEHYCWTDQEWSIDDTVNFTIDNQGTITNIVPLSVGDYPIEVTVTGGGVLSEIFTLTVLPPNQAPVVTDDSYAIDEDIVLSVDAVDGVLENDVDAEGDTMTVSLVSSSTHGTLALLSDGSFTYTPDTDYNGPDSFTYYATDGLLDSNIATVTITVVSVNDAPVAVDDFYVTNMDTILFIDAPGVFGNDYDVDGVIQDAAISMPMTTSHGELILTANGAFRYTPDPGWFGVDTFQYQCYSDTISNVATVYITVNIPPVAVDDTAGTDEDVTITIDVLTNDYDADGDLLSIVSIGLPTSGTAVINAGMVIYTPDANYNGPDSFTYTISDGNGGTDTATVTITVTPVDDPIDIDGDSQLVAMATAEGWSGDGTRYNPYIIENFDIDAGSGDFCIRVRNIFSTFFTIRNCHLSHGLYGVHLENVNVESIVEANEFYENTDAIHVSMSHAVILLRNTITGAEYAIHFLDVSSSHISENTLTGNEMGIVIEGGEGIEILSNSVTQTEEIAVFLRNTESCYVGGNILTSCEIGVYSYSTYSTLIGGNDISDSSRFGIYVCQGDAPTIGYNTLTHCGYAIEVDYTPHPYISENVITNSECGIFLVLSYDSIISENVFADNNYGIWCREVQQVYIFSNELSDNNLGIYMHLTTEDCYILDNKIRGGVTEVLDEGTNNVFEHNMYWSYSGTDADLDGIGDTPHIFSNNQDDTPWFGLSWAPAPSYQAILLGEDFSYDLDISSYWTGHQWTISDVVNFSIDSSGVITNIVSLPVGEYLLEVTVTGGGVLRGVFTLNVVASNTAPVAADDAYETNEDEILNVPAPGTLTNDVDADENPLEIYYTIPALIGALTVNPDGSFTYDPAPDWSGEEFFTYRVFDGIEYSNEATVTITVLPVNDVPVAANDAYSVEEDNQLSIPMPGVLTNDYDVDGDSFVGTSVVNGPSNGVVILNVDGSFVYTPNPDFSGVDSFTYVVYESSSSSSNEATVTIIVNPVNDLPVANDDTSTTDEDVPISIDVLVNDSDVDGDTLVITLVGLPLHGVAVIDAGMITYTPTDGFYGVDTFSYTISDGNGGTDTATVTITITRVDDPIDIDGDSQLVAMATAAGWSGDGSRYNPYVIENYDITGHGGSAILVRNILSTYFEIRNCHLSYCTIGIYLENVDTEVLVEANDFYDVEDAIYVHNVDYVTIRRNTISWAHGIAIHLRGISSAKILENTLINTRLGIYIEGGIGSEVSSNTVTQTEHAAIFLTNTQSSLVGGNILSFSESGIQALNNHHTAIGGNDIDRCHYGIEVSGGNAPTISSNTITRCDYAILLMDTPDSYIHENVLTENNEYGVYAHGVHGLLIHQNEITNNFYGIFMSPSTDECYILDNKIRGSYTEVIDDGTNNVFEHNMYWSYSGIDADLDEIGDTPHIFSNNQDATPWFSLSWVASPSDQAINLGEDFSYDLDISSYWTGHQWTISDTVNFSVDSLGVITNIVPLAAGDYPLEVTVIGGGVLTGVFTLSVIPPNQAPVANDDDITTDEDVPITIDVLANDYDADGDTLTIDSVGPASHGTITINEGMIIYAPDTNFNGVDSFSYTVSDGNGGTDTATVTITVNPVNDAPVANDDDVTTDEDTPLYIDVVANDYDVDSGSWYVFEVTQPSHGTVEIGISDIVNYYPDPDFHGTDSFTYSLDDGDGGVATATVFITVNSVNDAPVADAGGPYVADEGFPILLDASGSTDIDGDELQFRWDFDDDGNWDTFWSTDPSTTNIWYDDYTGDVKVEVTDGEFSVTDTTTVTVFNVAPIIDAGPDQLVNEGDMVSFSPSVIELGSDTLTYSWDFGDGSPIIYGTLTPNHPYGDNGIYTVTLTVTDDDGGVSSDTLSILVLNVAPSSVDAGPDQTVDEGDTVGFTCIFYDPGWLDTHTVVWDFGDGSPTDPGTLTPTHMYEDNGVYTVTLTVTDDDGGVGLDSLTVTVLDITPPVTSLSIDRLPDFNGWYTADVTVTLSAIDTGSGVTMTEYRINDNPWITYTTSFVISNDGNKRIRYRSTDTSGNVEATKEFLIRIDSIAPFTDLQFFFSSGSPQRGSDGNFWTSGEVVVCFNWDISFEDGSGYAVIDDSVYPPVYEVAYRIDDGPWQYLNLEQIDYSIYYPVDPMTLFPDTYGLPPIFTLDTEGMHTVYWYATDVAGNVEMTHIETFGIDLTPPELTIEIAGTEGLNDWWVSDVDVQVMAVDALSGILSEDSVVTLEDVMFYYRIDGGPIQTGWFHIIDNLPIGSGVPVFSPWISISGDGRHTFEVWVYDCTGYCGYPDTSNPSDANEGYAIDEISIDMIAPFTDLWFFFSSGSPQLGSDGDYWTNSEVLVCFDWDVSFEDGSGYALIDDSVYPPIYEVAYRIDDGPWQYLNLEQIDWTIYPLDPMTLFPDTQGLPPLFTLDTEGIHTVYWYAKDVAGNVEMTHIETFGIDLTPPEITIEIAGTEGLNDWWVSDVDVRVVALDTLSGIFPETAEVVLGDVMFYYRIDGGPIQTGWFHIIDNIPIGPSVPVFSPWISISGDDHHTFEVWVYDCAGYYSGANEGYAIDEINIDTTAPETTMTTELVSEGLNVTLDATDAISGVAVTFYSIDDMVTWEQYVSEFTLTAGGIVDVYYYSVDAAGNSESIKMESVILDNTPPVTVISFSEEAGDLMPIDGWFFGRVIVTLTATDDFSPVVETLYSFDTVNWIQYTSPFLVTEEGVTTIYFYSTDSVGNVEAPKSDVAKKDTEYPIVDFTFDGILGLEGCYITEGILSIIASDTSSGLYDVSYHIQSGTWIETGGFDGDGTDKIMQLDIFIPVEGVIYVSGHVHDIRWDTFYNWEFTIDLTPPETTISLSEEPADLMPIDGWFFGNVIVTLTASDSFSSVFATEYSFDMLNWITYTEPFLVTAEGETTVYFNSTDVQGHVELTKHEVVKKDTEYPTAEFVYDGTLGLNDWYVSDGTLTITVADTASGLYDVDWHITCGSWSEIDYFNGDGSEKSKVFPFYIPVEGVVDVWLTVRDIRWDISETWTFRIDTTAPDTTIGWSGIPSSFDGWYGEPVEIVLTATDDLSGVAMTEYSFDLVTWHVYSESFFLDTDGEHTVYFRSTDMAGNVEEIDYILPFKVDLTHPECTIELSGIMGDNGWYVSDVIVTITITDVLSGIDEVYVHLSSLYPEWDELFIYHYSGEQSVEIIHTLSLESKAISVTVLHVDVAGNDDQIGEHVLIDKTAPETSLSYVQSPGIGSVVTLTATDSTSGVASILYSLDGTKWHVYDSPFTLSSGGIVDVSYYAVDIAGNVESVNVAPVEVDVLPPMTTYELDGILGLGGWYISDVMVTLTATDDIMGVDSIAYSFDGVVWNEYTAPFTIPDEGLTRVYFNATDTVGNMELTQVFDVYIDKTMPTNVLTVGTPSHGFDPTYVAITTDFTLEAADAISGVDRIEYRVDSGDWIIYVSPFTVSDMGMHVIYYRSIDVAGNVETEQSLSIVVSATEITYTGDISGNYSDIIVLEAILVDSVTQLPIEGKTLEFVFGSQTAFAVTGLDGLASVSIILDQTAGLYTLTVTFASDGAYLGSSEDVEFVLEKEQATASYTGSTVISSLLETFTLRATIFDDDDGYWGDLTRIYVTITIYSNEMYIDSPILVEGPYLVEITEVEGVGVVTVEIPNLPIGTYLIVVSFEDDANGYYQGPDSDAVTLTIYEPSDDFVTGGGWIWDTEGHKGHFGFVVKYKSDGTLKGCFIYVYRDGDWLVIIKNTEWIGLAITDNHAYFEAECSIMQFNFRTREFVWSEESYTIKVDAWDNEDGVDVFQMRVYDVNGILWHEAGFDPYGYLQGGNIRIHTRD